MNIFLCVLLITIHEVQLVGWGPLWDTRWLTRISLARGQGWVLGRYGSCHSPPPLAGGTPVGDTKSPLCLRGPSRWGNHGDHSHGGNRLIIQPRARAHTHTHTRTQLSLKGFGEGPVSLRLLCFRVKSFNSSPGCCIVFDREHCWPLTRVRV